MGIAFIPAAMCFFCRSRPTVGLMSEWGGPVARCCAQHAPPVLFPLAFSLLANLTGNVGRSRGGPAVGSTLTPGREPPHPLINPTVGRLLQNKHIAAGINAMPISYARAGLKGLEETGGSSCHDVRNCQALMPTASRRERILAQCKVLADIGSPSQSFIHVASEKMGVVHSIQLQQL